MKPLQIEVFPEPVKFYVIPVTNFGSPNKKRVRVWPFIINTLGGSVTFTPYVDDIALPGTSTFITPDKETVRHFFTSDVFGVDYSGVFSSSTPFELWQTLEPDVVQVLPIAKRFDQVGPQELFKYGKIKQFELRVLPIGGSSINYTIYFNDNSKLASSIALVDSKEASYFIDVPKTIAGNIVRIEFGPTIFDFHRFYVRLQIAESGVDTELNWITLGVQSGQ